MLRQVNLLKLMKIIDKKKHKLISTFGFYSTPEVPGGRIYISSTTYPQQQVFIQFGQHRQTSNLKNSDTSRFCRLPRLLIAKFGSSNIIYSNAKANLLVLIKKITSNYDEDSEPTSKTHKSSPTLADHAYCRL